MSQEKESAVRLQAIIRTYVDISKRVSGTQADTVRLIQEDLGLGEADASAAVTAIW